jgi:hypothetical protein
MAIELVGIGALNGVASGNGTTGAVTGAGAGDVAIILGAQHDNVVATLPGGWTIVDATNSGVAARGWWAWSRLTAASVAVTVTRAAGDSMITQMAAFRGVIASGNPHTANSVLANAASATCTATAITPTVIDQMILFMVSSGDDSSFTAQSGINPVLSTTPFFSCEFGGEIIDSLTGSGLDSSIMMAGGIKKDTATTGNRTCTQVRTIENIGFLVALQEAATPAVIYPSAMDAMGQRTGRQLRAPSSSVGAAGPAAGRQLVPMMSRGPNTARVGLDANPNLSAGPRIIS